MPKKFLRLVIIGVYLFSLTACSIEHISMHITSNYIKYKIESLNSESDLLKVEQQLPKNIASLKQLIAKNKQNKELHIYAAQAYYSYAFAFIEDKDINKATWLYSQAYHHAKKHWLYMAFQSRIYKAAQ